MTKKSQDSSARVVGRIAATLLTTAMIIGTGIFGALGLPLLITRRCNSVRSSA